MGGRTKLLIVDDEPVILQSLSILFLPSGVECATADHAPTALKRMEEELFHVVLSDIKMPEMGGVELLRAIKRVNPMCQVIMMTGYSSMDLVVECLGHGALDYFLKPFTDFVALQDAVSQAAGRVARWQGVMRDTFRRGDADGNG